MVDEYVGDILEGWDNESTILLGESHINSVHKAIEEEVINRIDPEYLLFEGLKEHDPDEVRLDNEPLTLMDLAEMYYEKFPENPSYLGISSGKILENISNSPPVNSKIEQFERPDTKQDLMNTPFYRMGDSAIRQVKQSLMKRKREEMEEFHKWSNESAFDKRQFEDDEKISRLAETYERLDSFESNVVDTRHPILDYISQQNPSIRLAGADLDPGKEESLRNIFEHAFPEDSDRYANMMREVAMAERIEKYESRSEGAVSVVILGGFHIDNVSDLVENDVYKVDLSEYFETTDIERMQQYKDEVSGF